ncbi:hypothetical protein [Aeromicrobium phragmitis]|uniref:hypothetical protein n=1 Tax=Aeromicrobium phragmitis TaxID=2478914 RepID=UPI00105D292F|nr:hypothetical protein [Aeromicrobium phragmitis]
MRTLTNPSRTSTALLLAAGLALGGFFAGSSVAGAGSAGEAGPESSSSVPTFAVNDRGQTYGSEFGVPFEDRPDLIQAEGTDGTEGYVSRELLDEVTGADVANPQEAIEYQEAQRRATTNEVTVPLLARDGVTVVGEFAIDMNPVVTER